MWGKDCMADFLCRRFEFANCHLLDLVAMSNDERVRFRLIGQKRWARVDEKLAELGLTRGMKIADGTREELNRRIEAGEA